MRQIKTILTFLAFIALLLISSCDKKNPTLEKTNDLPYSDLPPGSWAVLGLQGKYIPSLKISDPYLYACCGPDGLWRNNIRELNSNWEYLGLMDTTGGGGVNDILVSDQDKRWLLITYKAIPSTSHTIYRSFDGGFRWSYADSGLGYSSYGGWYFNRVDKFLKVSDKILVSGMGIYSTSDFGNSWQEKWVVAYGGGPEIYSFISSSEKIWSGGMTVTGNPFLATSTNNGNNWESISVTQIFPAGSYSISCISIDPFNNSNMYASWDPLMKSTDGGVSWFPLDSSSYRIWADPRQQNHFWSISPFIETWDGGNSWQPAPNPLSVSGIWDVIWDSRINVFFIGTLNGVYLFKP